MLQLQLIALYDRPAAWYVCRYYATHSALHYQRLSNNCCPAFTDQELMIIYLFGLIKQRATLRQTYDYIIEHGEGWFPKLPSYQAVSYRLNQIGCHFEPLIDCLCAHLQGRPDLLPDVLLADSLPIILSRRPATAKVAPALADKGYCATKKLWYHGVNRTADAVAPAEHRPAGAHAPAPVRLVHGRFGQRSARAGLGVTRPAGTSGGG